jgi:DNA-3-methyladenine glycosylase I
VSDDRGDTRGASATEDPRHSRPAPDHATHSAPRPPTDLSPDVVVGDDGVPRCAWSAGDAEYRRYHDEEWGVPLHGDVPLFEKLSLEGFQAGLSWITILRRRAAFRDAFEGFDPARVARFGADDVDRLVADVRIIRNRAKIAATVANAVIVLELTRAREGAFDELMWGFAPPPSGRVRPRAPSDVAAVTPESTALSSALRARGFRFVGPTTMHALMQSAGMVDDHLVGCWRA